MEMPKGEHGEEAAEQQIEAWMGEMAFTTAKLVQEPSAGAWMC